MHAISLRARVFAGIAVAVIATTADVAAASNKPRSTPFRMFPVTSFVDCMTPYPHAPTPEVTVKVNRHDPNDTASLELKGFKPNLDFALFTMEHSPQTRPVVLAVGQWPKPGRLPSRLDCLSERFSFNDLLGFLTFCFFGDLSPIAPPS
jgi:hypothetical protein